MRTEKLPFLTARGRQIPEAMVRPAPPAPITAADLGITDTFRALYRDELTALPFVRQRLDPHRLHSMTRMDGRRGGEILAGDLIDLRNATAPPTTGRLILDRLTELHETLYSGDAAPCLMTLALAESEADHAEDRVTELLRITGEINTPTGKRAAADVLRRQAATSLEMARALERSARRDERSPA